MSRGHSPFALNFAIPCGAPGLGFLCRESFDRGRSHFDHPLGSRFEEMECVVFFDDVLVPWERVFLVLGVALLMAETLGNAQLPHPRMVEILLYERFFAGDPLTRARFVNGIYPKDELMERVRAFLREPPDAP
jgi:4-hydroxyphenylacetate 3-monooxygenase